ncbi:PHP domain-containing protein [archaeon]|nr:PHP domain-containing protein [Nanoarchaeota archaeon]MBU4299689.1 PHP domain-containing protein [Nanoarchaeota archaeon]MBU4451211.1 PHP domain-containing protein [Nanoarchaeota archaeon]MCG2723309.1 PHP domain-containing protein [archaeon]
MVRYFDMHITTNYSFGTDSVAEIVKMAERLELDTICIADASDTVEKLAEIKNEISNIRSTVNVVLGVEILAKNPNDMANKVTRFRDIADIIIVSGGDIDINRAACENPKVDILAHPEYKRKDSGIDHVIAAAAAKNKVAIELNFRSFLHSTGRQRAYLLASMQRNAMLCKKFDAPVIVTSAAENVWGMRAGKDLSTLAYLAGMDVENAITTVSTIPEFLIRRVKEIKSPEFVMPGVKLVGQ